MKEMYTDLIAAAKEAYQNAYVPYSKFPVGAALKLKDGSIINGANVENASFGLTIVQSAQLYLQLLQKVIVVTILRPLQL